jgi:formamidase
MTEGSRVTLPVDVTGALCSIGDAHFAQGDGESCAQGIEMSATVVIRFELTKASNVAWRPRNPLIEFAEPHRPTSRRFLATIGFPVAEDGRNEYLDTTLAARAALLEMIRYLTKVRGFSDNQAYVLASVAVDLRISEIVDSPNAIVCAVLPLDIFETSR